MLMDSSKCGDAVGRYLQLRGGLRIFDRSALYRKQAGDQLQTVQQSMFTLLEQNIFLLDGFFPFDAPPYLHG